MEEKTQINDIDRSIYDIKDEEKDAYRIQAGLTPEIVEKISKEKHDPAWMELFRLQSLQIYNEMKVPDWGPSIEGLDMSNIATYVRPNTKMTAKWSEVPQDIKDTFERLGIPQAERKSLAGVGAQYDSELVYHNVRKEVEEQGVVYTDMESALTGPYADMVRKHFMKLVKPTDHKFAALHGAVWSGGSFVYVPPHVSVEIPLQSYFRLNAPGAGQFEHTLIIVDEGADLHFIEGCSAPKYNVANLHAGCVELFVGKNARLRYSTIENWSKNMYNLNTKRAQVEEGGVIEWVSGSFGSHVSYLYPMSILKGRGARMEFTGITFAGKGQDLDTGAKVVHAAPDTSSFMNTRSISKDGGVSTFRSSVSVTKEAKNSRSSVSCQSLMLDSISRSDTIPAMDIRTKDADIGHEARIGRISDEAVFYLMSRGLSEEDARAMIVSGFADNVSKELPLEYAVEMNNLIRLEMKEALVKQSEIWLVNGKEVPHMGQGLDMTVNSLPSRTWNWLKMNESKLKDIKAGDAWEAETVKVENDKTADAQAETDFSGIATGMGADMDRLGEMAGSSPIFIKSSEKTGTKSEPVRLHFSCKEGKKSFQKVEILAKEGEEVNVLMDYISPEKTSSGLAAIQTKLHIEKGAKVRLVQVQLLGKDYTLLNDIGAECEEGAQFEVLQLFLGSSKTYSGCLADLKGRESHFKADIGYQGKDSQRYDMNYVAVHKGKKTVSEMNADGILDDQAFKLFRGTIDFKNGSSGSKGDEKEDVLLMGDNVVNQTIPLILCAEEDVEGNHGASIGQLDEEMLFYLSSRGMSKESASKMIARARMDAVCQKIGDEELEKLVQDYLEEE